MCKTVCGTYREAALELARIRVECAEDRPVPTVGEAHDMWFAPMLSRRVREGRIKQATAEKYERSWRSHARARWGAVPLDSVRPLDVQAWLMGLPAGPARDALSMLRRIGELAVRYEAVSSNKFGGQFELPARERVRARDTLTLAQADETLSRLYGADLEAPFILACFGGCRTGESLGVKCAEVELAESCGLSLAVVPIVRRMGHVGDLPMADGDMKTAQSVRTAVIPEPYGTRLLEIAHSLMEEGRFWLADRDDGLPMNRRRLNYRWGAVVGGRVPFSNLRPSWRTFAQYEWGVDPDTLEILMGHVIPTVTGKHYLRPTTANLVEAVAGAVAKSRCAAPADPSPGSEEFRHAAPAISAPEKSRLAST